MHISVVNEDETLIGQNQLIGRKIKAQQKQKEEFLMNNKILIQLVEKYSENIEIISYMMKDRHNYNCARRIKTLFFKAMIFVEKEIYQHISQKYGLQFKKLQMIASNLIKNESQLQQLRLKLIIVLRHLYFNQEIHQKDILLAFESIKKACQSSLINKKTKIEYEDNKQNKNKQIEQQKYEQVKLNIEQNKIVEQIKEEKKYPQPQEQLQNRPKRVRSHKRRMKRQESQLKRTSDIDENEKSQTKTGRKSIIDLWTPEQQMKMNEIYQKTNDTLLVPLAAEMLQIYQDKSKFAEQKVKSKFKSLFRTGLLRLQELASRLFGVQVIYPYKIYYKLAGKMLQSRSKLITHDMKKKIMNINFTDNISRSQLTTVLDGVMQYLKNERDIRQEQ